MHHLYLLSLYLKFTTLALFIYKLSFVIHKGGQQNAFLDILKSVFTFMILNPHNSNLFSRDYLFPSISQVVKRLSTIFVFNRSNAWKNYLNSERCSTCNSIKKKHHQNVKVRIKLASSREPHRSL